MRGGLSRSRFEPLAFSGAGPGGACSLPPRQTGSEPMSVGLIALLDDVAALAKVAAASLDDVAGQAAKAGAKAAGVVDRRRGGHAALRRRLRRRARAADRRQDRAGLAEEQAAVPAAGGAGCSACFAALGDHAAADDRRRLSLLRGRGEGLRGDRAARGARARGELGTAALDAQALEDEKVASAIKTDFILSAEIMAITLAAVPDEPLLDAGVVLALVGVGITAAVYGVVALIVKADDVGVALAGTPASCSAGCARDRPRPRARHAGLPAGARASSAPRR